MFDLRKLAIDSFLEREVVRDLLTSWSDVYNRIGLNLSVISGYTTQPNASFSYMYNGDEARTATSDSNGYFEILVDNSTYYSCFEFLKNATNVSSVDFSNSNIVLADTDGFTDMFSGCTSLTSVTGVKSITMSENFYTNTDGMFKGSAITSFDGISPTSTQLVNFESMFEDCASLTTCDMTTMPTYDNISGCYADKAFKDCTSLTTLSFGKLELSECSEFLQGCTSLTSLSVSDLRTSLDFDTWGIDNLSNDSLISIMGNTHESNNKYIHYSVAQIASIKDEEDEDVKDAYCTARGNRWSINYNYGTTIKGTSSDASGTITYNVGGVDYTANVVNHEFTFDLPTAVSLEGLFNTSTASKIKSVDLSDCDTTYTTSIKEIFNGCDNISSVTFGSANINSLSNLTNISGAFEGTTLSTIWFTYELKQCTNASRLFADNESLTTVTLPQLPQGASTLNAFSGSTNVTSVTMASGNKASWDFSGLTLNNTSLTSILTACANQEVYDNPTISFSSANNATILADTTLNGLMTTAIAKGWTFSIQPITHSYYNASDGNFLTSDNGRIIIQS